MKKLLKGLLLLLAMGTISTMSAKSAEKLDSPTGCPAKTVYIVFYDGVTSKTVRSLTSNAYDCMAKYYTLPSCWFTRAGHTFVGWKVEDECSDGWTVMQPYDELWLTTECVKFRITAIWRATQPTLTYTLTVNPNGGYLSGGNFGAGNGTSRTVYLTVRHGGSAYSALGVAHRSGYRFNGWWTSSYGGTQVFDASGRYRAGTYWTGAGRWQYYGNLSIYAQWIQDPSYTVYVNPNGGYLNGGNFGSKNGTTQTAYITVTKGRQAYFALGRATRPGYTFGGWSIYSSGGNPRVWDSNGNGLPGTYWNYSKQWIYSGNVYVYANWIPVAQNYTVYVNPNGGYLNGGNFGSKNGTTQTAYITVTKGRQAYFALGRATRPGYTFGGWSIYSSGGNPRVWDSNGNGLPGTYWNYSKQWIYSGNVYVYANWIPASGGGNGLTTGGNARWTQQTDGSWRSGSIVDGQSTWLQKTVTGRGYLSFRWKVSCEGSVSSTSWDYLVLIVDGVEQSRIAGTDAIWGGMECNLDWYGTHTVRWEYHKDGSVSRGSDCGWVDSISWRAY